MSVKPCIFAAVIITALDILAVRHIENTLALFFVILGITGAGVGMLYAWIVRPVMSMKHRLKEMEIENSRIENMRREFVANVTHELKTPLTSISGFIETLQDGAAEDPEIRTKFIDIMAIETARLKRLIDDILVLSEIENKKDVKSEKLNIKDAIEGTVDAILPIADRRKIKLYIDVDPDMYLEGNEDKFRQMIMNLVENAIKYSPEGKRVWITGKRVRNKIEVAVRDEGIGISKEHLDRLFERFYRVDKSRSREQGGTGLGLSIVKHTAALFNGEPSVESTPGEGTVFKVTFKCGPKDEEGYG